MQTTEPDMEVRPITASMERLAGISADDARGADAARIVADQVLPEADRDQRERILSMLENRTGSEEITAKAPATVLGTTPQADVLQSRTNPDPVLLRRVEETVARDHLKSFNRSVNRRSSVAHSQDTYDSACGFRVLDNRQKCGSRRSG